MQLNKKIIVILNPIAGKGRGRNFVDKLNNLQKTFPNRFSVVITGSKGDAANIAAKSNSDEYLLIVAGGDGTISEVINCTSDELKFTLAILPLGSGNDSARALNFTGDPGELLKQILSAQNTGTIDLGMINLSCNSIQVFSKSFLSACGIGFDAYAGYISNRNKYLKGMLLYLTSVLKALRTYKPFLARYSFDDSGIFDGEHLLITFGNSKTTGGGFLLTPEAVINDGLLNSCRIKSLSIVEILKKLPLAISGKHQHLKEVTMQSFRKCNLSLKSKAYMHTDGEVIEIEADSEISIQCLPNRLKIVKL